MLKTGARNRHIYDLVAECYRVEDTSVEEDYVIDMFNIYRSKQRQQKGKIERSCIKAKWNLKAEDRCNGIYNTRTEFMYREIHYEMYGFKEFCIQGGRCLLNGSRILSILLTQQFI